MRARLLLLAAALVLGASPLHAQPATSSPESVPPLELFPRFAFHLSAEHLGSDDERFVWDANFGADVDLLKYGSARGTFTANYQVVMGEEFRRFDPNQGNYILAGALTFDLGAVEVAGVFHHESRHLSDRPNEIAVAWNMLGGRIRRHAAWRAADLDARLDVRGAVQRSHVDYRWEMDGGVRNLVSVHRQVALLAVGSLRVIGVDESRTRATQTGFRAEGGVRVEGTRAAVELFVSGERRLDPYPLEFGTATWLTVGFRVVSR